MFLMSALSVMSALSALSVMPALSAPPSAGYWRTCNLRGWNFDVRPKKPDFPRVSGLGGQSGHGGHVIYKKRVLVRLSLCFPLLGGQSGHVADIKKTGHFLCPPHVRLCPPGRIIFTETDSCDSCLHTIKARKKSKRRTHHERGKEAAAGEDRRE